MAEVPCILDGKYFSVTSRSDGKIVARLERASMKRMEFSALKETYWHLEEKSKKQENELLALCEKQSVLERELRKANQSLIRSKKAKEFEILLNENESMQRKLQNQEEEFQLQNETLLAELSQLVKANEALAVENKMLKDSSQGQKGKEGNCSLLHDEIRRLQAQNTALQNSLLACQQQLTMSHLDSDDVRQKEWHTLESTFSEQRVEPLIKSGTESEGNGNIQEFIHPGEEPRNTISNDNSFHGDGFSISRMTDDARKLINELRLNLETEKAEKWLLREQLKNTEIKYQEETDGLRCEVERTSEKLRKKQESLLQLQEDKDCLYRELSQKIREAESDREVQLERLKKHQNQLEHDMTAANKVAEERAEHFRICSSRLESELVSLQQQLDRSGRENGQRMLEQTGELEKHIHRLDQRNREQNSIIDDLKTQLKESKDAQTSTMDQLLAIQLDRDQQILALQETNRVAEKRKTLLDELAIKYQQDADRHKEQTTAVSRQHTDRVNELTDQVDQLSGKVVDLDNLRMEVEKMRSNMQQLEGAKSWLERSLKETEEKLEQTRDDFEALLKSREAEHETSRMNLIQEHSKSVEATNAEMEALKKENKDYSKTMERLQQEIKDGLEDKKLHEKKGATALKDLKRQLLAERKRADKLQEKLQDSMSDSKCRRQSMEELFRPINFYERQKSGDSSSISSLSPSALSRDNILSQSPDDDCSFVNLQQDNEELVKRLADVQQQKWILEEKVSHLESSNAAMAEDLIQKAALIDHFSTDGKAGHHTHPLSSQEKMTPLKRVVDFVMDKGGSGEESLRDTNRRLQNVVEEMLTKNMYLQQNLEVISRELDDLRKLHPLPGATCELIATCE